MKNPKILVFDIETSPNLGYCWGKWQQDIIEYKSEWELLSVAYKWLGEKEVHCISRPDFTDKTDKTITKELWKLFDEADVLLAHNGDEFDVKKAKAKFVEHDLKPPSTYKTIDTKKIAKSQFNFNSNSLNSLGTLLRLGNKLQTGGFQLWLDCMAGDKKAWKKMISYNKQDVELLEKVYLKLRAWSPSHPNLSLMADKPITNCPVCASDDVQRRGVQVCVKIKKQRFQCRKCGHWFQGKAAKA